MQTRLFGNFCWLAVLLAVLGGAGAVRAADPSDSARFLLIFETSPTMKKSLPAVQQELAGLFGSNLQNEIRTDDDLAVWTVDETAHTAAFPLANWAPDDADGYAQRLDNFLGHQKFNRHASLAGIQPLLSRVVKNSARLTVIIFCDSESRLAGTPYDSGVNDIITNAAAKAKGVVVPFILVLRAYQGEYIGCSVNRSGTLSFPKFPPPPKPEPPPAANPPPVAVKPAPMPASGPAVTPIAALVIVGTNAATNLPAAAKLPPPPAPAPAPTPAPIPLIISNPPVTNAPASISPAPVAPAAVITAPAATTAPVSPAPATVAPTVAPTTSSSPPAAASTVTQTGAQPGGVNAAEPAVPAALVASSTAGTGSGTRGSLWPMVAGGGALVVAGSLVGWLVIRARRPRGSLITSCMIDDPRLPPRK